MRKAATYSNIQGWVRAKYHFKAESCWIAHAKELSGLEVRKAANRINPQKRKIPCPPEKLAAIQSAFKHFGMIE